MLWPGPADYAPAVGGFPHVSLLDPKLKGGKPKRSPTNLLLVYSGGFSTVFPIEVAADIYALRCWTRDIGDAKNRYEKISAYLKQVRLPYFVDFEYVPEGILINGRKYPITRMEWAEGASLRDFIAQNLQNAAIFKTLADKFQKMVADLHAHQISHGDLQNGNILLERRGTDVEIKLIDYDSLFVPALRGQPSPTPGLPEYQHPARGSLSNEKVDYFSELVIYLSFLTLAEKPGIWDQFDLENRTGDGLLFSKEDFENPDKSDIFQELEKLSPDIQQLAATLKDFCAKTSIDQLEPLEVILPKPDANTHSDRGDAFLNKGRYNEAIAEFQKAIVLDPNYEKAHYGIGRVYLHSKRYTDAINAFEQLIKGNPNYKEAHHGLGLAYFKSGDNNKATAAANAALRIDRGYQPARQLLDAIRSATSASVSPKPKPPPPDPTSDPVPPIPDSVLPTPNPRTNVWQYLTALLGIVLAICVVVLAAQVDERNTALREVNKLTGQQDDENSEIQQLTSDLQTLKEEKRTLTSENRKLKSQLAEKDTEIQRLTSRVRALEPLTSGSAELAGMVLIPAGEFRMGSNATAAYSDEKPVHTVYVNGFYIDRYEVTNEEYKKFIDANPQWQKDRILSKYHDGDYLKGWAANRYPYGKRDHPVTWVSWYAAMAYAQWKGKRLPTEAEWEKAARGGLVFNNYLSGSLVNSQTANYDRNVGSTTGVGNYQANPYGLYDMVGNVSEWCLDAYSSNFYANSPRRNPVASGNIGSIVRDFKNLRANRVLRGGSWSSTARIAYRFTNSPIRTSNTNGFRCVRPVNP